MLNDCDIINSTIIINLEHNITTLLQTHPSYRKHCWSLIMATVNIIELSCEDRRTSTLYCLVEQISERAGFPPLVHRGVWSWAIGKYLYLLIDNIIGPLLSGAVVMICYWLATRKIPACFTLQGGIATRFWKKPAFHELQLNILKGRPSSITSLPWLAIALAGDEGFYERPLVFCEIFFHLVFRTMYIWNNPL